MIAPRFPTISIELLTRIGGLRGEPDRPLSFREQAKLLRVIQAAQASSRDDWQYVTGITAGWMVRFGPDMLFDDHGLCFTVTYQLPCGHFPLGNRELWYGVDITSQDMLAAGKELSKQINTELAHHAFHVPDAADDKDFL